MDEGRWIWGVLAAFGADRPLAPTGGIGLWWRQVDGAGRHLHSRRLPRTTRYRFRNGKPLAWDGLYYATYSERVWQFLGRRD